MDIQDKVALVTGAGAGIGRVIAGRLAREGAAVVVADLNEKGGAETVRQIHADSGRAAFALADVAVEADVRAIIAFAERHFGGLDILVNNAGGVTEPFFPKADPEHWTRAIDVNLRGVMLGIQFGIEAMRKRGGGAIVNISSMAGIGYQWHDAPEYAVSKAGVVRLTAVLGPLKDELGIRVNCICPGWVETPAVQHALETMTPDERAALAFPPPRILRQPEEIAAAAIMFILDETLAGRVMVWPDGEPWRIISADDQY
ncbi:MAG: SDR family oxidoreductase [Candidatus Tectomicrobia bacterium]|nr:SDR family oxidoreductase [Candidatus Tectomicrobia bacterium]